MAGRESSNSYHGNYRAVTSYHHTRSPERYSRSPELYSRSPKRYSRSPKRYSRSPKRKRYSRSPKRYSRSPHERYSRSPKRYSRSPETERYSRSPKSYSRSPKRYSRFSPDRRGGDEISFYNPTHPAYSEHLENHITQAPAPSNHGYITQAPPPSNPSNLFSNDGSFLELVKGKLAETKPDNHGDMVTNHGNMVTNHGKMVTNHGNQPREILPASASHVQAPKRSLLTRKIPQKKLRPLVKGVVKKEKKPKGTTNSAWEAYMREVEAYKSNSCADDDRFSRPLCK